MDVVTLGAALNGAKAYTDATIAPLLGGVHYRGSVNYFNNLPSNPSEGDAYTVKYSGTSGTSPDGTEYVWALDTEDNTYKWIGFSPDTYTKAEVDNLLNGKQATIDSSHKLSSDLVDDSAATNKFVTASDKTKLGRVIMDGTETQDYYMQDSTPSSPSEGDYWFTDEPIVSADVSAMTGYAKAQTASAIAATDTLNEAMGKLEKKADDNTTGLSSKQNQVLGSWTAGTSTSHVTPTGTDTVLQVLQKIDNNQRNDEANISANLGVAKNLLVNRGSLSNNDITYTWVNGDVSVTGTKRSEGKTAVNVIPVTPLSDLGLSDKVVISNNGTNCLLDVIFWSETLGLSSIYEIVSGSNIIDIPSGYTHIMARLGVKNGVVGSINETIQPMICTKAQWDISHEYQPYPFSNAELTAKEQTNENNILEQQRLGYLQNYNLSPIIGGIKTSAGTIDRKELYLPAGTYYVSWKASRTTGSGTATMAFYDGIDTIVGQATITNSTTRTEVSVTLTDDCVAYELINNSNIHANIIQVMITSTANQSYVPYAPSNAELYAMIQALQS